MVEVLVRRLTSVSELEDARLVCDSVWVNPNNGTEITSNLLRALQHSGGYVAAAYLAEAPKDPIGAVISFIGRHQDDSGGWHSHLHSHMTAVMPGARDLGIGTKLKLDQRAWALENQIDVIAWTFDPLVRRNLRINVLKLGIDVKSYYENFYGTMEDSQNAGDETDRIFAWWNLNSNKTLAAIAGNTKPLVKLPSDAVVIKVPDDIVALRSQNPVAALRVRYHVRAEIQAALDAGLELIGLDDADSYVFARSK